MLHRYVGELEDEADAEEDRLLRLSMANDDGWDEGDWREDWSPWRS